MNDPMRILKADHREAEKLLKQLSDSEEGSERQKMVDELTMKLTVHMEMEETLIYPTVRESDGQDKLNSMVEMPGFGAAVEMLKGGIMHHVEEEENELLPELKDAVSRDEWAAMGDAIAAAK